MRGAVFRNRMRCRMERSNGAEKGKGSVMLRLDNFVEDACRLFADRQDNIMEVPASLMARAATEDCPEPQSKTMQVFAPVLVGVAAADDPIFREFREPHVIGEGFILPSEWLEGAASVVSLFFPFAKEVCITNRHPGEASPEWQYAKYRGTQLVGAFCTQLCEELRESGWEALMPVASERFGFSQNPCECDGEADFEVCSAWSERHAAYACGLGTFGLSRGLITRSGMAGRFGSIITTAPIAPTPREYSDTYEWCTFCGACVKRCPVDAISLIDGKRNTLCSDWCKALPDGSVYGDACGKCQVGVPCSTRKPVSLRPKPRR